jgi:very-short-patch-repair endonuclease
MFVKLTQEKANQLDAAVGAIPIGEYVHSKTKREYKCVDCGCIYLCRPNDVRNKRCIRCYECGQKIGHIIQRLKIEDVKKIIKSKGFEPLFDEYVNVETKLKLRCKCGNEFKTIFNSIRNNETKSCGHCNDPKIGNKFGKLTIIEKRISNVGHGCKVKCKCDCGKNINKWYDSTIVRNGKITSCGHCKDPNIGDKFWKLTVIEVRHAQSGGCSVKCRCDCGNVIKWNKAYDIINKIQSCGHCDDPKVGDKFGQLTIIEVKPSKGIGCKIKCKCDCGYITKLYNSYTVTGGNTTSCGNCELQRNGVLTSNIALKLHDLVEKILDKKCEHNKRIGRHSIDIVQEDYKIAIEYDGYYWHRMYKNTTEKEKILDKMLKQKGYKLLRIRSGGGDIPTESQLRKILLNDFQHGSKKRTITMKSWTESEKRYL